MLTWKSTGFLNSCEYIVKYMQISTASAHQTVASGVTFSPQRAKWRNISRCPLEVQWDSTKAANILQNTYKCQPSWCTKQWLLGLHFFIKVQNEAIFRDANSKFNGIPQHLRIYCKIHINVNRISAPNSGFWDHISSSKCKMKQYF